MQLLRSETDEKPVLIDTGMRITNVRWNNAGEPVRLCACASERASVCVRACACVCVRVRACVCVRA